MPNSAAMRALLTVFLVGSAGSGSALAKKRTTTASLDARLCSKFSQRVDKELRGLVFQLENRCSEPLKCTISWATRCARASSVAHDDATTLDGGEQKDFEAPTGCTPEQAWEVTQATWQCKPVSQATAAK